MSWEVRTMRSKTSYFNGALMRKNLTRFWPLWAVYAAAWLLAGPVSRFVTAFGRYAEPDAALRDELSGRVRDAVRACLHIPRWSVHPGGDEEHLLLVPGQGQDLHLPGRVGGDVAALGQLGHPPIDLLVGEAGDIHYR